MLLIPNLLSEAECELLRTASEGKAEDINKTEAAKLRMSVLDHTRESKGDVVHGGLGLHCGTPCSTSDCSLSCRPGCPTRSEQQHVSFELTFKPANFY